MHVRTVVLPLLTAVLILGVPAWLVATTYPGWDTWAMYGVAAATTIAALATIAPRGHVTRRRTLVRHYEPGQR